MHTNEPHATGCDDEGHPVYTFAFDPHSVTLRHTPFGVVVDLPQGRKDGTPGGPGLPIVVVELALPPGQRLRQWRVDLGESVCLCKDQPVAPLQPAAPGGHHCTGFERVRADGLVAALPGPPFVPPDPKLYQQAIELGRTPVQVVAHDDSGLQSIVRVVLRPLTIDEHGALMLHTSIRITLLLEPASPNDENTEPQRFNSHAQAQRWTELARSRVINPAALLDIGGLFGRYYGPAEYLVITDNQRWDADTQRPSGAAGGDLVAEFARLVAWKRAKGLTARVVSIADILAGVYGDFAGSCQRDLQEVLREFVKFAHAQWGTAWLLLGGDTEIVPVRRVVGFVGGFRPADTDPPALGGAFWTGSLLKIRADDVAANWDLMNSATGVRIPYDLAGTSSATRAGWFFVDASYGMRSNMPTGQIRVNGPAADLNGELFWLNDDNTIPTDLYYADVAGYAARAPGGHWLTVAGLKATDRMVRWCDPHDWDRTGNRLYGQWNSAGTLDGVRYVADLSVGRAPVDSAEHARTFVDKVIAYERGGGSPFSQAWLRKLLVVSSNWGGRTSFGPANPLADNSWIKRSTDNHAVIQLAAAPSSFDLKLISVVSATDQRELPFRLDAAPTQRGWRFARSATDSSPSVIHIPLPWWPSWTIPIPSRWIVVFGSAQEMSPGQFVLDESTADGSMLDQETLRQQLATDVPGWSNVRRLYEDEIDLPAPAGPPLEHLTDAGLHARLSEGQHIVSLSGHGWWGGCCGLDPTMRTSLTNGGRTFVAYADSCLTNQFDMPDAISESLLQCQTGGAVAYVGNTRFSWIGVGDDFQRHFFKGLPTTRALGLLHDRRLQMLGANTGFFGVYNHWTVFSLNLIGDPEMRLWTSPPRRLCVDLPDRIHINRTLTVQTQLDDRQAAQVVVTLWQGGQMRQQRSDGAGRVFFDLKGLKPGPLELTAVHPQAAALTLALDLLGPSWLDVKVKALRSQSDSITALVDTAQGERTLTLAKDSPDLIALLSQAAAGGLPLRLQVDPNGQVEGAEWTAAIKAASSDPEENIGCAAPSHSRKDP
ncbi:hypothetical protein BH11PSE10_BH11PSE10_17850 [soil metagenome]